MFTNTQNKQPTKQGGPDLARRSATSANRNVDLTIDALTAIEPDPQSDSRGAGAEPWPLALERGVDRTTLGWSGEPREPTTPLERQRPGLAEPQRSETWHPQVGEGKQHTETARCPALGEG